MLPPHRRVRWSGLLFGDQQSLYPGFNECYFILLMTTPNLQVRRATIEDLPQLVLLWRREGFAVSDLEKRFKEFQVIDAPEGGLAAAVGLQIAGSEARLHSEAFARNEQADACRLLIWERAQVVAKNHGLVRLWTQFATPFWNHSGFRHPTTEMLTKLPPAFAGDPRPWQFLQLKDDAAAPVSVDKEFEMVRAIEQERTAAVMRQAKMLKVLAVVIVLVVLAVFAVGMFAWMKTRGQLPR